MAEQSASDLGLELAYWREIHLELGAISADVGTLSDLAATVATLIVILASSATPPQWPSLTTAAEQAGETMRTLLSMQRRLQTVLDLAGGRIKILAVRAEELHCVD